MYIQLNRIIFVCDNNDKPINVNLFPQIKEYTIDELYNVVDYLLSNYDILEKFYRQPVFNDSSFYTINKLEDKLITIFNN